MTSGESEKMYAHHVPHTYPALAPNTKTPRNLARFRGIFTYARLDSNQRPSESEL